MRRSIARPLLVGVFVLLTASAFVPTAQAATVEWDLTNVGAGTTQSRFVMDAAGTAGGAAAFIPIGDGQVWVSNVVADQALNLDGNWVVNLLFTDITNVGVMPVTATISLGTAAAGSGAFTAVSTKSMAITELDPVANDPFPVVGYTVAQGEHLAVRITIGGGSASLSVDQSGSSPSTIQSPDTDPSFPVPELGSVLLLASGLVVVAGVVYSKKRQNKE